MESLPKKQMLWISRHTMTTAQREDLEQNWKQKQEPEKQDERYFNKSESETVLPSPEYVRRPVEDAVLLPLRFESLQKAMDALDHQSCELIDFRYDRCLIMKEIGKFYSVSKMAVSPDVSRNYVA